MRKMLAAAFLVALFAGCLDSETDAADDPALGGHEHADVPRVDAAALLADLRTFAETYPQRSGNSADHEGARDWLMAKFESFGLETYRYDFENGIPQADILGIKWGALRDQWVVVGGHYDIVPTPACPDAVPLECPAGVESQGMYDDGSGTMMTVHLAKAFANVNTTYTYVFVAFDGEERGLQGSGAFAEDFPAGNTSFGELTIRGMLDLDMFGLNWPGVDAPIYFDSNAPELDAEVKRLVEEIGMPADQVKYQGISLGRSDYAHFFNLEIPTGFFISSFEEYQAPADIPAAAQNPAVSAYPFWHRLDTWETMVLMAGSEADVQSGFQAAVDLALGVLCFLGDPEATFTVEAAE